MNPPIHPLIYHPLSRRWGAYHEISNCRSYETLDMHWRISRPVFSLAGMIYRT